MERIKLMHGDITKQKVDVIVNAANKSLLGGGGVDGAIHRTAGRQLLEECKILKGCETGNAKITKGYNLTAKYVIHAVGPVWFDGNRNEKKLLASSYMRSLEVAAENYCKTIAFPNISTGIYGFPKHLAAEIAINTVKEFLANNIDIETVIFVCFDAENYEIYKKMLNK